MARFYNVRHWISRDSARKSSNPLCFASRARPLHYLLKPVDREKLEELIWEDCRRRYQNGRLCLKAGGKHTALA